MQIDITETCLRYTTVKKAAYVFNFLSCLGKVNANFMKEGILDPEGFF